MSYSFTVVAPTKAEAKVKIVAEMDRVVAAQATHSTDRDEAIGGAVAFLDMVTDPQEGEQVQVAVHGSIGTDGQRGITHASIGVTASLVRK